MTKSQIKMGKRYWSKSHKCGCEVIGIENDWSGFIAILLDEPKGHDFAYPGNISEENLRRARPNKGYWVFATELDTLSEIKQDILSVL